MILKMNTEDEGRGKESLRLEKRWESGGLDSVMGSLLEVRTTVYEVKHTVY